MADGAGQSGIRLGASPDAGPHFSRPVVPERGPRRLDLGTLHHGPNDQSLELVTTCQTQLTHCHIGLDPKCFWGASTALWREAPDIIGHGAIGGIRRIAEHPKFRSADWTVLMILKLTRNCGSLSNVPLLLSPSLPLHDDKSFNAFATLLRRASQAALPPGEVN